MFTLLLKISLWIPCLVSYQTLFYATVLLFLSYYYKWKNHRTHIDSTLVGNFRILPCRHFLLCFFYHSVCSFLQIWRLFTSFFLSLYISSFIPLLLYQGSVKIKALNVIDDGHGQKQLFCTNSLCLRVIDFTDDVLKCQLIHTIILSIIPR